MWPEVTGMGEQDETADGDSGDDGDEAAAANLNVNRDEGGPIEIPDDDDDDGRDDDAPTADSPFGGTGLGAIATANRNAARV